MTCFCSQAALPEKQSWLIFKMPNAKFICKSCQSNHIYLMATTFDTKNIVWILSRFFGFVSFLRDHEKFNISSLRKNK